MIRSKKIIISLAALDIIVGVALVGTPLIATAQPLPASVPEDVMTTGNTNQDPSSTGDANSGSVTESVQTVFTADEQGECPNVSDDNGGLVDPTSSASVATTSASCNVSVPADVQTTQDQPGSNQTQGVPEDVQTTQNTSNTQGVPEDVQTTQTAKYFSYHPSAKHYHRAHRRPVAEKNQ